MKPLVYSDEALRDMEGILHHISRHNRRAAVAFVEAIEITCRAIARNPQLGERRFDLATSLRRFSYRSYAIYYRDLDDRVRIERVLHGARDIRPDFFA